VTTVQIEAFSGSSDSIKWRGVVYEVGTSEGRAALGIAIRRRIGFPPAKFSVLKCILTIDPDVTADVVEHVFLVTANAGSERLEVVDRLSGTRAILFAQGGKLLDEYDPVFADDAPSVSSFTMATWKNPADSKVFLWAAITKDAISALDQTDVNFADSNWQAKLKQYRLILLVDRESRSGELIAVVAAAQIARPTGPLVLWTPIR